MNVKIFCVFGLLIIIKGVKCQQCGSKKEVSYARLPDQKTLLYLDEVDKFIVDRQMSEMYFALSIPKAFEPDVNYKSTITKDTGSSQYTQTTKGETVAANPTCASGSVSLSPMFGTNKAMFFRENSTSQVQAMWSSCPTRYVWSMRCSNYKFGQMKCLNKDVNLGVYIHGDMNNVPMNEIMEDLCRATGVKFGSPSFEWSFSFGENTLC